MAIVRDYMDGPTHILIDDAYCKNQTDEEANAILERLAEIAYPQLKKQYLDSLKQNNTAGTAKTP